MRRRTVIALDIVLDGKFPIGVDVIGLAVRNFCICPAMGAVAAVQHLLHLRKAERLLRERHEDQALDNSERDLLKAVPTFVERRLHMPCRTELAVYAIGPSVIGAYQNPRVASSLAADSRPAVAADVNKR